MDFLSFFLVKSLFCCFPSLFFVSCLSIYGSAASQSLISVISLSPVLSYPVTLESTVDVPMGLLAVSAHDS